MTKKKAFIEHSVKFALWLVKACIVVSALTGAVIAASIFVCQGTMFLVKEHGILWALPVLVCSGMILHLMWPEFRSRSEREEAKVERDEAAPRKARPRWRRNAPATLTKVPLSRWTLASLTILRQIELALDSHRLHKLQRAHDLILDYLTDTDTCIAWVDDQHPRGYGQVDGIHTIGTDPVPGLTRADLAHIRDVLFY